MSSSCLCLCLCRCIVFAQLQFAVRTKNNKSWPNSIRSAFRLPVCAVVCGPKRRCETKIENAKWLCFRFAAQVHTRLGENRENRGRKSGENKYSYINHKQTKSICSMNIILIACASHSAISKADR